MPVVKRDGVPSGVQNRRRRAPRTAGFRAGSSRRVSRAVSRPTASAMALRVSVRLEATAAAAVPRSPRYRVRGMVDPRPRRHGPAPASRRPGVPPGLATFSSNRTQTHVVSAKIARTAITPAMTKAEGVILAQAEVAERQARDGEGRGRDRRERQRTGICADAGTQGREHGAGPPPCPFWSWAGSGGRAAPDRGLEVSWRGSPPQTAFRIGSSGGTSSQAAPMGSPSSENSVSGQDLGAAGAVAIDEVRQHHLRLPAFLNAQSAPRRCRSLRPFRPFRRANS
jgi:hypothetical protein